MTIPIRNIYYLLCYAWGELPTSSIARVGSEDGPDLQNLLARALLNGLRNRLRRRLYCQYVEASEDVFSPRGRILVEECIKRSLKRRGQLHCSFDEFSEDVLPNQIIKSVVGRLQRSSAIDSEIQKELYTLNRRLSGINEISLTRSTFRRVQIHGNNAYYRFLIHICELLCFHLLPRRDGDDFSFYNILENELIMWRVFERFVKNFYRLEQGHYEVGASIIDWDVDDSKSTEGALSLLPVMKNDIRLVHNDETIIIDTKYYKDALTHRFDRDRFRSENLYQMYAYLKNLSSTEQGVTIRGILLYPTAGSTVDEVLSIQGHLIHVKTIDLGQSWQKIHDDLLALIFPN